VEVPKPFIYTDVQMIHTLVKKFKLNIWNPQFPMQIMRIFLIMLLL